VGDWSSSWNDHRVKAEGAKGIFAPSAFFFSPNFPDEYIYQPLYIFCGDDLLRARLRTADKGAAHGVLAEVRHTRYFFTGGRSGTSVKASQ
jgi:hypothetical protein